MKKAPEGTAVKQSRRHERGWRGRWGAHPSGMAVSQCRATAPAGESKPVAVAVPQPACKVGLFCQVVAAEIRGRALTSGNSAAPCSNLESDVASQLGLGLGFLVCELIALRCAYVRLELSLCVCMSVFMHACFVQSCLVSVCTQVQTV